MAKDKAEAKKPAVKKAETVTDKPVGLPEAVAKEFRLKPGIPARTYLIPKLGLTVDLRTISLDQARALAAKHNTLIEPIKAEEEE